MCGLPLRSMSVGCTAERHDQHGALRLLANRLESVLDGEPRWRPPSGAASFAGGKTPPVHDAQRRTRLRAAALCYRSEMTGSTGSQDWVTSPRPPHPPATVSSEMTSFEQLETNHKIAETPYYRRAPDVLTRLLRSTLPRPSESWPARSRGVRLPDLNVRRPSARFCQMPIGPELGAVSEQPSTEGAASHGIAGAR